MRKSRMKHQRRVQASVFLLLAIAIVFGFLVSSPESERVPTVELAQPRSSDGTAVPAISVSPSSAASAPKDATQEETTEGGSPSNEVPPSIGGNYEVVTSDKPFVPEDKNKLTDVYRHDLDTGEYIRVSVSNSEKEADASSRTSDDSMSANGRFIVFSSEASNLVPRDEDGTDWNGGWSEEDIFLRDLVEGTTTLVDIWEDGTQLGGIGDLSLSAKGRHLAFAAIPAWAPNYTTVYVYDFEARSLIAVTDQQKGEGSFRPDISADGRYVAFQSSEDLTGDPCSTETSCEGPYIYIRDLDLGSTELISITPEGHKPNGGSYLPVLSDDARFVRFVSCATNLLVEEAEPPAFEKCHSYLEWDDTEFEPYVRDRERNETTSGT